MKVEISEKEVILLNHLLSRFVHLQDIASSDTYRLDELNYTKKEIFQLGERMNKLTNY